MLSYDSAFWRRLAYWGARHGPDFWLKYSPPVFGAVFACALPSARQSIRQTLQWVRGPVQPGLEIRQVLGTFVAYAQCLAESLAEGRSDRPAHRFRRSGSEELQTALDRGCGAVAVTAHVGPWDVAARALREVTGAPVIVAMSREPDSAARALHDKVRERGGIDIAHVGNHPLEALPLLRHLRAGGIVAMQLDRGSPSGRMLSVQLFGRAFQVPEGPFRLAALAGAPLLPIFARRHGYFDYEVVLSPPIDLPRRSSREALEVAAQQAADALAGFVRESPTQWFRFEQESGTRVPDP